MLGIAKADIKIGQVCAIDDGMVKPYATDRVPVGVAMRPIKKGESVTIGYRGDIATQASFVVSCSQAADMPHVVETK